MYSRLFSWGPTKMLWSADLNEKISTRKLEVIISKQILYPKKSRSNSLPCDYPRYYYDYNYVIDIA